MSYIVSGCVIDSYTEPSTQFTYTNVWAQIKQINLTPNVSCHIFVDIYVNQQSYESGRGPIKFNVLDNKVCFYNTPQWDEYFYNNIITIPNALSYINYCI